MGAGNRVSMLCRGEAIGHGLHNRLLQCAATAQIQRRIAAERGRTGLLENSKDGGLKHLTTTLVDFMVEHGDGSLEMTYRENRTGREIGCRQIASYFQATKVLKRFFSSTGKI